MMTKTTSPTGEWRWTVALTMGAALVAVVGWMAYAAVAFMIKAGGATLLAVVLAGGLVSLAIVGFSLHLLQRDSTAPGTAKGEESKTIPLSGTKAEHQTELKKAA
jgi:hypothetical protein